MQVVITSGVVAIRKRYSVYRRFANELISLDALAEIGYVPKIIADHLRPSIIYQYFIPGENLGSLMVARGASVSIQYRVGKSYPGPGAWSGAEPKSNERLQLLRALHDSIDAAFIEALEQLFVKIHRAGVALRDIKHGNVLIYNGQPYWCDFDLSRRFRRNSPRFLLARDRERDRFNYLFDGSLATLRSLEQQLASLRERAGRQLPPAYFGRGHGSIDLSLESGTGRWLRMRKRLPPVRGVTVIDLGCDTVVAMEILRKGADRAVALALDPLLAEYAKLTHSFFELIDNRGYSLELVEAQAADQTQLATAANTMILALSTPRRSAADCLQWGLIGRLSKETVTVVADSSTDAESGQSESSLTRLQRVLAQLGFSDQSTFARPGAAGGLVIATRPPGKPTTTGKGPP
jgi:hypothetical protein